MINSPADLLQIMQDQNCMHWQLYRVYNSNNPTPIATSESLGPEPDLSKSIRALGDLFNRLGPGTYFVKYNTKNIFNKGFYSDDVTNNVQSGVIGNGNAGIGSFGAVPAGYVTVAEMQAAIDKIKYEHEKSELEKRIGALESGEGTKTFIQQFLESPEIKQGIGNLIANLTQKFITPQPVIRQASTIGNVGFNETAETKTETPKQKNDNADDADDVDETMPDHIKSLSDKDFNAQMDELDKLMLTLWYAQPDFPDFFKKFTAAALANPTVYQTAKQYFK